MAHPIVVMFFLLGTLLFPIQGATFVTGGGGSFDSPLINTLGDAYKVLFLRSYLPHYGHLFFLRFA